MARKQTWSEAELRLPAWLRDYNGHGDDDCNYLLPKRDWRVMRNKALRSIEPIRVHRSVGEALLTETHALLLDIVKDGCAAHFRDRLVAQGLAMERALESMAAAKVNRQAGAAKARATKPPKGAPRAHYKVTDAQGFSIVLVGLIAVAAHIKSTPGNVAAQLSRDGGQAWIGRRNPETSWTVERVDG